MNISNKSIWPVAVIVGALLFVLVEADRKNANDEWIIFKEKYGRVFANKKEEAKRKKLFLETYRQVEQRYKEGRNVTGNLEFNEFADWTPQEIKRLSGTVSPSVIPDPLPSIYLPQLSNLPYKMDYRSDPCVGPIKAQGSACSSCWAFTAIAPLEFRLCKSRGYYTSLSEQQLVNCCFNGCLGGYFANAWTYLQGTPTGSVSSAFLPYMAQYLNGLIKPVTWGWLPSNENSIMAGLAQFGPLAAAINVDIEFVRYTGGIYQPINCLKNLASLNHAVVIVGWGNEPTTGSKYWVIRNSWGPNWGINGYMLMPRGTNTCGIEVTVAYVQ